MGDKIETINCVVVGDKEVDTTTLLTSYTTSAYPGEDFPTVFDNISVNVNVGGKPYLLGLCDTSNQEYYPWLRPMTFQKADVFLVCFSVDLPSTFENVTGNWVPEIQHHCPNTPFLLVGTQIELRDDKGRIEGLAERKQQPITAEQGGKLAKKLKAVKYVEVSALTQKGLKSAMEEAVLAAVLQPSEEKPKNKKCILQ